MAADTLCVCPMATWLWVCRSVIIIIIIIIIMACPGPTVNGLNVGFSGLPQCSTGVYYDLNSMSKYQLW